MELTSIIMPVYNGEKFISEAIDSLLRQTYKNIEIIIIDDGSSDSTVNLIKKEMASSDKIMLIENTTNSGAAAARNVGLENSRGKYIVFADSDDIQKPYRVEKIIDAFNQTGCDLLVNDFTKINKNGEQISGGLGIPDYIDSNNILLYSLKRNYLWTALAAIKGKLRNYRFDPTIKHSEDYDYFLRILFGGYKFSYLKEKLTYYRDNEGSISSNLKGCKAATKDILLKFKQEELYKKFIDLGLDKKKVNLALGVYCYKTEDIKGAITFLNKALEMPSQDSNDNFENYYYLAVTSYEGNELMKSRDYLNKCLDYRKDEASVYNNLGVIELLISGDREKAVNFFKTALEIKKEYMDASINLKRISQHTTHFVLTKDPLREFLVHNYHDE